jgi:hypothetical protein
MPSLDKRHHACVGSSTQLCTFDESPFKLPEAQSMMVPVLADKVELTYNLIYFFFLHANIS